MLEIIAAILLVGTVAPGSTALADAPEAKADFSAYPELSFDRALPAIAKSLNTLLNDPGSVSNFFACPTPVKVKFDKGRPKQWTFLFSLNAKNRLGGYAGASGYAAVFKSDGSMRAFSILGQLTDTRDCHRIPDAEIQKLIAG